MKLTFYILIFTFIAGCGLHQQTTTEITTDTSIIVVNSIGDTSTIDTSTTVIKTSQIKDTQTVEQQPYNFEFEIIRYFPYCGGAAPTEEMLNRYSPEKAEFVLTNLKTNKKTTFKTDSLGVKKMQLKSGKYGIKEKFKDVPFDEFYANFYQKSNNFAKSQGKDCYREWWKSNLVEFEITDTTTVLKKKIVIQDACFIGKNPCLEFVGPNPP